jgi:hypothetical protein
LGLATTIPTREASSASVVTEVMSFLINQDGVVIEKDLGEKTVEVAQTITEFNPNETWEPVE